MPDPAVMNGVLRHLRRTERRRLYHLLGDRELLARFLADRDEAAFEEVVTRHGPMVRAVCRRVLGPTADADDAFQAAFLVLIRKARSIRRADLLAGWLCAVAYRTARQALRRRARLGAREQVMATLPEPARPDDPPVDWLPLFDAALQRLPAKYRDPVVLCELQGVSRRDASARLGLTEGTLSSRLGRARDLLRRKLGRHGFPLAVGASLAPAVVPEALTASTVAASVHVSAASVSAVVLTEGVLTAMFASKLKAGALAGSAVLFAGVVAGLQFSGPASGAGGPPGKDGPIAKDVAREQPKGAPVREPAPRPAAEYELFQGKWEVTVAEREGSATTPANVGVEETWVFSANKLTTGTEVKDDAPEEFTINPRAKPGTIDFTLTQFEPGGSGALARMSFQGIYRFEPDGRLTICYRRKAEGILRPTRFATAINAGVTLIGLRRPEPARDAAPVAFDFGMPTTGKMPEPANRSAPSKPDPARDADLGKVVGAWELVDVDGQPTNVASANLAKDGAGRSRRRWEALSRLQLLPGNGPQDLANQPGAISYIAYADLDGTRSPKWMTLYSTETHQDIGPGGSAGFSTRKVRLCGIYKLDGDKLLICLPQAEGSPLLRPTDFKGDGEGGLYLLTYQRAAKTWKPDVKTSPTPVPMNPPVAGGPLPGLADGPANDLPAPPGIRETGGLPAISPSTPFEPGVTFPPAPSLGVPAGIPGVPPPGGGGPLPPSDLAPPGLASGPPISPGTVVDAPGSNTARATDPVAPPSIEPAKALLSDLDRLQGVWVATHLDGKPVPAAERGDTLEFLKDRVLGSDGSHGRVRVDESKVPRQFTIVMTKQPEHTMVAIYKIEGDKLTLANCNRTSKLIPTGFEPDNEAGVSVVIYERSKGEGLGKNSDAGLSGTVTDKARPIIPPAATDPTGKVSAPPRDLAKEVEQLREQLRRLEIELKERK